MLGALIVCDPSQAYETEHEEDLRKTKQYGSLKPPIQENEEDLQKAKMTGSVQFNHILMAFFI